MSTRVTSGIARRRAGPRTRLRPRCPRGAGRRGSPSRFASGASDDGLTAEALRVEREERERVGRRLVDAARRVVRTGVGRQPFDERRGRAVVARLDRTGEPVELELREVRGQRSLAHPAEGEPLVRAARRARPGSRRRPRARRRPTSARRSSTAARRRPSSRRPRPVTYSVFAWSASLSTSESSFASSSGCVATTTSSRRVAHPDRGDGVPERGLDVAIPLQLLLGELLVELDDELRLAREAVEQRLHLLPLVGVEARVELHVADRVRRREADRGRAARVVPAAARERERPERRCEPDLHSSVGRRPIRLASRSERGMPLRTVHTPSVIGSSTPSR